MTSLSLLDLIICNQRCSDSCAKDSDQSISYPLRPESHIHVSYDQGNLYTVTRCQRVALEETFVTIGEEALGQWLAVGRWFWGHMDFLGQDIG